MHITYHCDGTKVPTVQYDSGFQDADRYYYHADPPPAPETKGWNTAIVSCPKARLSGHPNGESDFRLPPPDNQDICIAKISMGHQ
jgi:hypothetical protein